MIQRNWLDLSRKLVDRLDLNFSFTAVQEIISEYALAQFGEGVLITTTYPSPFPITMSGSNLTGTVGNGIAFDPNGQITRIDSSSSTSKTFTITPADPTYPRWDLLVLEYVQTGDTPVPQPSDPINTIFLNLHDDFNLKVIQGTPSVTPSYPTKGSLDIILAGIKIPATSTIGTQCTVDYSIRDMGLNNLASYPVFFQETPTGAIDGSNTIFSLSQAPVNGRSVLIRLNGVVLAQSVDYSINNQTITMFTPPAPAQSLSAYYVVNSGSSTNPVSGYQEIPTGTVDGTNNIFNLAGKPQNQYSMLVFVDGLSLDSTQWGLVQSGSGYSVDFFAGSIPQPGQSIYVFYLMSVLNPVIITVGGSGELTALGTGTSPITITASSGITPDNTQRQIIYTTSTGGAVTITSNPQIAAGTVVGQELYLQGTSSINYIILTDGNGVSLNGSINLTSNSGVLLVWNGAVWSEIARR